VIPGSKPKIDAYAKVRIGEKKVSQGGKESPAATDYFLCDDPAFTDVAGSKPSTLRIAFVHDSMEDAFSTGLEWWVKKRGATKPTLACYTKDGGANPVALRMDQMLDEGQEPVGPAKKGGRLPIACPARECPHFKSKDCKPMGRLVFVLDGGTHVYQIDTKAWNSIEKISGALGVAQASGPLNRPGRFFDLSVAMVQQGTDKFPVMSIQEADVQVNSPADVEKADALVLLAGVVLRAHVDDDVKQYLAVALDFTNPGWRDNELFIERIREVGAIAAAKGLIERNL